MALSELEITLCEKPLAAFMRKRRPPVHIRDKLDLAYRIKGQSIEIFTIRPHWEDASRKTEEAVAKATYNRKANIWKIFWQRADMKWHGYQPHLEAESVEEFLYVVDKDDHGCFFG